MSPSAKLPLRILDTGLRPARWNVAMTAALAELHSDGAANTVRIHRYPACVLLGAAQDVASTADVDYCRQTGMAIARRVTGGGAVYMSPGLLAWDVLVDRKSKCGGLDAINRRVCGGVAAGLSRLGVVARFRAPNDIEIGGRKVSGSSGYSIGSTAVLQGTVLVQDSVPEMARALRLPETALRERVTCLESEIGALPTLHAITKCIVAGLGDALGGRACSSEPTVSELDLCERLLRDEIGTEAYVHGLAATPK